MRFNFTSCSSCDHVYSTHRNPFGMFVLVAMFCIVLFNLFGCDILINFFFRRNDDSTVGRSSMEFCVSLILSRYRHVLTIPNFSTSTSTFHGHNMILHIFRVCVSFLCCCFSLTSHHITSLFIQMFWRFVCCFNCGFLIDGSKTSTNDSFNELKIYQHNLCVYEIQYNNDSKTPKYEFEQKNHGTWSFFDTICT